MRAVILAAGKGSRIADITGGQPKCLLKIKNETILGRQLRILQESNCKPRLVVGYQAEEILKLHGWQVPDVVFNPLWSISNTLVSLLFGVSDNPVDTLVINGDVVFEEDLIKKMLKENYNAAAVQTMSEPTDEEVKVCLGEGGNVRSIGKDFKNSFLEAVGVYLFRAPLIREIREVVGGIHEQTDMYYEDALDLLLMRHPMSVCMTKAVEIDTPEDYRLAKEVFVDGKGQQALR